MTSLVKAMLAFALFLGAAWLIHDVPTLLFYGLGMTVVVGAVAWVAVRVRRDAAVSMSDEELAAIVEAASASPEPVESVAPAAGVASVTA